MRWVRDLSTGLVHDIDDAKQQIFLDSEEVGPIAGTHISKDIDVKGESVQAEKIDAH